MRCKTCSEDGWEPEELTEGECINCATDTEVIDLLDNEKLRAANKDLASKLHAANNKLQVYALYSPALIAAAPEMLGALKNILADARMALDDSWDRSDEGFECQVKTITEIINKATT